MTAYSPGCTDRTSNGFSKACDLSCAMSPTCSRTTVLSLLSVTAMTRNASINDKRCSLVELLAHGGILVDQVRKLLRLIRQIFAEREQHDGCRKRNRDQTHCEKKTPARAPNESLPNHHTAPVDQIEHGREPLTICWIGTHCSSGTEQSSRLAQACTCSSCCFNGQ